MFRLKAFSIVGLGIAIALSGCGQKMDTDELVKGVLGDNESEAAAASEKMVEAGDEVADRLISILRDEHLRLKHLRIVKIFLEMQKAGTLKDFKINKVAGVLGDVLRDKETAAETKLEIAQALANFKAPTSVRPLIAVLDSDSEALRDASMASLTELGAIAVDPLVGIRDDEGTASGKRESVTRALEKVAKSLAGKLTSEDAAERQKTVQLLGKIGSKAARGFVTQAPAVGDEDAKVRAAVVAAIAPEPTEAELVVLAKLAGDKDQSVAIEAIAALGTAKAPGAAGHLTSVIAFSGDDSTGFAETKHRVRAIEAMVVLGDPEVIPALGFALLKDGEAKVCRAAALALESFGDKAEREAMLSAMKTEEQDDKVRLICARALGKMGVQDGVQQLVGLLDLKDSTVRIPAIKALGEVGDPAVSALVACLQNPASTPARRASTCEALGTIGSGDAVDALVASIRRPVPEIPARTAEEEEAAKDLFVSGEEPHIAAIQALSRIGDPKCISPICDLLASESERLRGFAEWSLSQLRAKGPDELTDKLVARLTRPDSWLLEPDDIIDIRGIAGKVGNPDDPFAAMLRDKLSDATQKALEDVKKAEEPEEADEEAKKAKEAQEDQLRNALAEELNGLLRGGALHDDDLFVNVWVPRQLATLAGKALGGEDLLRLNRALLWHAFPDEVKPHSHPVTAGLLARILGGSGGERAPAALAALASLLDDQTILFQPEVSIEVVRSISDLVKGGARPDEEVVKRLRKLAERSPELEDLAQENLLRGTCVDALGQLKDPQSLPVLVRMLTSEQDERLRFRITAAAGRILASDVEEKGKAASELELLAKVVVGDGELTAGIDSLNSIQRQAVLRLGEMKDLNAVPAIVKVLKGSAPGQELYDAASLAYLRITGRRYEAGE